MSVKVLTKSEVQDSVRSVVCQACWPRPPLPLIHLLRTERTEAGCWKGGSEAPTDSPLGQLLFSLALIVTSPGPPGPHVCALLSPRSALLPQPVELGDCFWWNTIHCVTWVGHTRFALRERAKYWTHPQLRNSHFMSLLRSLRLRTRAGRPSVSYNT